VNSTPNRTVKKRLSKASSYSLTRIAWWAQVTVTPDERRTMVFSSGTPQGDRGLTPTGGQLLPSSTLGASLLWKKAQKNISSSLNYCNGNDKNAKESK